jgi:phosphoserine phosphatase
VDNPVAVDPDEKLTEFARTAGWPIISLRQGKCPAEHFHK